MLHPQAANEECQRHDQSNLDEPRIAIEPSLYGSHARGCQHQYQPDIHVNPKQRGDLFLTDRLALNRRLRQSLNPQTLGQEW